MRRIEWACATERLLCRLAVLRTCALRPTRLSLVVPAGSGRYGHAPQETADIAVTVDEALDEGCRRWGLDRPRVLLVPGPAYEEMATAA